MDFLKTCSTNIQTVDEIHLLSYTIYTKAETSDHHALLVKLRESDILCCEHNNKLYTFNSTAEHSLDHGSLVVEEEGTIRQHMTRLPTSEIVDRFQDAIEQGMSFRLVAHKQLFKLGSWSWLSIRGHAEHSSQATLTRVRTRFILPGTLSFASLSKRVHLTAISEDAEIQNDGMILSPSGLAGTLLQTKDNDRYEDNSTEQAWRTSLTQALMCQGIFLGDDEAWARVELGDHPNVPISWPLRLCFAKRAPPASISKQISDHLDPLTFAQQWAESTAEREQALLVDQLEDPEAADVDDQMELVTSPPFQFRPGLTNMVGIYPTPPDGMTSHTIAQASLSQENTVQSHQDLNLESSDLFRVQTHDGDMTLESRDSVASSAGVDIQHDTDDLFGEPDTELGGAEVDEDDFDFFDDSGGPILATQAQRQASILVDMPVTAIQAPDNSHAPVDDAADYTMVDAVLSLGDSTISQLATESQPIPDEDFGPATNEIATSLQTRNSLGLPKPLSPFDIRERLLPPPIPASMSNHNSQSSSFKRHNSFAPIEFNPDLRLGARAQSYVDHMQAPLRRHSSLVLTPADTSACDLEAHDSPARPMQYHSSDSSSDDDASDVSMERCRPLPPHLPWQTRKRKRISSIEGKESMSWCVQASPAPMAQLTNITSLLDYVLRPTSTERLLFYPDTAYESPVSQSMPYVETYPGINAKDLLMVAQLVSEQAVTCTDSLVEQLDRLQAASTDEQCDREALQNKIASTLKDVLPASRNPDPITLALQREPPRPSGMQASKQPRPPPRPDNAPATEVYALAAPYLRFQRAETNIDMLPPAVHFWEALSLAPVNLGKNIQLSFVIPDQVGLRSRLAGFQDDLTAVYEGCKLGSLKNDTNGIMSPWLVKVDEAGSNNDIYHAYQSTCMRLADHLAERAFEDPESSFIVMLVQSHEDAALTHMLCACFWSLYKSYRDRVTVKGSFKKASDVCLQLLPASMMCSLDILTLLSGPQLGTLAREIYDRCPPGEQVKITSPLSIATTPSLVLADPLPKRINFQLNAFAPTDLLYEGSELHVAYAKSADGFWITAIWTDNTGSSQHVSSFSLRGTTTAAVFTEIWNRSLDIIRARQVSWRIGIATTDVVDELEVQCWRDIMSLQTSRRVSIHASLLLIQPTPLLRVTAPMQDATSSAGPGGVITPVSTPQTSGFTVSPDAFGQTAPLTPAPTEPSAEVETDAHLVDLSDETWGMLLDPKFDFVQHEGGSISTIAQGVLLKHGETEHGGPLPIAGVSIVFTLRIRGPGNAVEDATARQAEVLLKELLTAYRGLGLLTKTRGLGRPDSQGLPVHVVCARKSADILSGLLRP